MPTSIFSPLPCPIADCAGILAVRLRYRLLEFLRRYSIINERRPDNGGDDMGSKCREGHEKHICQMKEDLEAIRKLVREPEYICKNCGRAAREKENLCNPTKL
jgi:hypothetical protein